MTESASPTVPFFKKKSRPATSRKRDTTPPSSSFDASAPSAGPSSEVIVPTKKSVANPLIQGTKRKLASRDDSTDDYDPLIDPDRGPDVKWKASGNIQDSVDVQRRLLEKEDEESEAKKARREAEDEERLDDGLYRGAASYKNHIKKEKEIPKAMRVGPQKSNSTIRTVTIMDYQPDVCKDYKETGFCGFGDTCKFLHDRGTYLQGWQLDKLAADPKKGADEDSDSDSDEEDIPWACFICRKPYTDPIVTKCSHYFCSSCAVKRFAKTPKCAACGAPTAGIFNRADKVVEKMKKKKADKELREAEKEARGSDEEDESKDLELDLPEL